MLNEWYKSGLTVLNNFLKKKDGLIFQTKNPPLKEPLELTVQNTSKILENILNKEQSEAYYYNFKKKKVEKYYLNEKLSNFSKIFFQQLMPAIKQDKQEFNKLSIKEQKIIEDFIKKNNLKKTKIIREKNSKEFVLTSKRESMPDFLKRFLQGLKEDKTSRCVFCNHKGGLTIKGWFFPFIIDKNKFPNLYPEAKIASLKVCKNCTAILFAAYKNIFYSSNQDYLNFLFFYSDNEYVLNRFLKRLKEEFSSNFVYSNYWKNFKVDGVNYPYEFLSELLNKIATNSRYNLNQQENSQIGVAIFGLETKGKKVWHFAEKIDNIHIMLQILRKIWEKAPIIKETGQKINIFPVFTKSFLEYNFKTKRYNFKKKDGFVKRNKFLRELFFFKKINWQLLEDVLFKNIKERRSTLPYNETILPIIMDVLNMPKEEKELYEKISKQGYNFGKKLLEVEGRKEKVVKYIYDLRRTRQLVDFLDQANNLQLRAKISFDERSFKENENVFRNLKVYFLIGMANAIFASQKEKYEQN
ncbi:hypothetical protein J7J41_02545 [bacterium]|nr:hypothetical protein [bacterium]